MNPTKRTYRREEWPTADLNEMDDKRLRNVIYARRAEAQSKVRDVPDRPVDYATLEPCDEDVFWMQGPHTIEARYEVEKHTAALELLHDLMAWIDRLTAEAHRRGLRLTEWTDRERLKRMPDAYAWVLASARQYEQEEITCSHCGHPRYRWRRRSA